MFRALILVVGLVALIARAGFPDDSDVAKATVPLDLPAPGRGAEELDEDAPESITFYGSEYEGDAFFWCLDKSCSMGWDGEIETLKQETTDAILQLSSRAEFGINAFSSNTVVWASGPRRASTANKQSAVGWVQQLQPDGWTCLGPAAVQILAIARESGARRSSVLILGDGQPWCDGVDTGPAVLADVASANYSSIPVHTLYISSSSDGVAFFQQLAQQNGGTFTLVP
ncbi:MAG: hypothetical protein KDC38_05345 [Planctomycetes bacterium]|nr:hypothetical protein [Planctomycetota bacterium]